MSDVNVVKTTDVAPKLIKVPKSFNDLNREQLVAAALSFGADEVGTKEEIKASLLESGVEFAAFHPDETPPEPEPILAVQEAETLGGEDVLLVEEVQTIDPNQGVGTQTKWLVKMTRDNPYFEYGRYKFTAEKPYAIMSAKDTDEILRTEFGFRQAFPSELEEYYDMSN